MLSSRLKKASYKLLSLGWMLARRTARNSLINSGEVRGQEVTDGSEHFFNNIVRRDL